MNDIINHYDKLIDENNDPFNDPPAVKEYMDKWDGQAFIDEMQLDSSKTVLEICVGTGRLAGRVCGMCKQFTGIDFSPKTIQRAKENLKQFKNTELICADFFAYDFNNRFDVVYSSLTFFHFADKQAAIRKIASLLKDNGRFILSISKDTEETVDYGDRKITFYQDDPAQIRIFLAESGLKIINAFETEFAYIFTSIKI
jgi:ubiquinone/menaquinone biosynthesis C-methylase UbiE